MIRQHALGQLKARGIQRDSESTDDDDAFLDRMSSILDTIARECSTVGGSGNAKAVLAKASSAFEDVQRMCREAGVVQPDNSAERVKPSSVYDSTEYRSAAIKPIEFALHQSPTYPAQDGCKSRERHRLSLGSVEDDDSSVTARTPVYYRTPASSGEDIIQVEITDILTSTQEEIQKWKHEFRIEMMEQEARHHKEKKIHLEQIHALKEALEDSQKNIAKLCREVGDTNTKLEALQAVTNKSHKAMELTLREHTQYWKAICHDLVAEKKSIATRLAEERGKNHALREHLGMHESQGRDVGRGHDVDSQPRPRHSKTSQEDGYTIHQGSSRFQTSPHAVDEESSQPQSSFRRYYLTKKPGSL